MQLFHDALVSFAERRVIYMKIIISPAKKMNVDTDTFPIAGTPLFLDKTRILCDQIKGLSYEQAKALWQCNDKLAQLNFDRFVHMDLEEGLTPAVLSYEGLQYQHMAPMVFTDSAYEYIQKHLRILSGFYGVLAPFDGVTPYRLEMQAKLAVGDAGDLYEFWGGRLYEAVLDEDRTILNLASKEYARAVERYVTPKDRFITVEFGELMDGKIKQKGTFAKMARGEMVRFLAECQIEDMERLKEFTALDYHYRAELSDDKTLVFLK